MKIPFISKKLSQWVGFDAVSNKNNLPFGVDVSFKFSKLPWVVNECVKTSKPIDKTSKPIVKTSKPIVKTSKPIVKTSKPTKAEIVNI
jgi:hypothetical protein